MRALSRVWRYCLLQSGLGQTMPPVVAHPHVALDIFVDGVCLIGDAQ